jgi:hypothetical protein
VSYSEYVLWLVELKSMPKRELEKSELVGT